MSVALRAQAPSVLPALRAASALVFVTVVALAAGAAVAVMGAWALALALYGGLAALCIADPRRGALALLALAIAIEPNAIDATEPLSAALYGLPPMVEGLAPLTVHPLELLLVLVAVSVAARRRRAREAPRALPMVAWLVPLLIVGGIVYGVVQGGETNVAWHELRGLVFGTVAFWVVMRLDGPGAALKGVVLASTLALAAIVTVRHVWFEVYRETAIPNEFLYAHEDAVFLGVGFVVGVAFALRAPTAGGKAAYLLYSLLILVAMMASGRRAAILVGIVGLAFVAWAMFPRRPWLVLGLGVPALVAGGVYLAAFWDAESGVLAQPARAVRSQVDPAPRDASSDNYRRDELHNIAVTLERSPLLGVGFGRPFELERPLPELDFWPLQFHTPHQNVLWLWLKMGLAGVANFLALWAIALQRCLTAFRAAPRGSLPLLPLAIACTLLMYLFYASVDLAFISARSAVPLAVAMALAFRLPGAGSEDVP
ncbi:MAG: hypothetical protein Kow0010_21560 [Dehalococcoidia bacterium]